MQTHQSQIPGGRDRVNEIRSELFALSEVLEVFVASGPDALVVICSGRPRPEAGRPAPAEYRLATRRVSHQDIVLA